MPEGLHKTVKIQVWVDVDEGIADLVLYLNTIPGVRTCASCQGTIGEGGPHPYPPQVMITWRDDAAFERLAAEFYMTQIGDHWCYVHPKSADSLVYVQSERKSFTLTTIDEKVAAYDRESPDVRIRWENTRILERDPQMFEIIKRQRRLQRLLTEAQEVSLELDEAVAALVKERYLGE